MSFQTNGTIHGDCQNCGAICETSAKACSPECAKALEYGMLVLSRRFGEAILIDKHIAVRVEWKKGNQCRLIIYAPKSMPIDRLECTDFKLPERKQ